jgi:hypothetical protein
VSSFGSWLTATRDGVQPPGHHQKGLYNGLADRVMYFCNLKPSKTKALLYMALDHYVSQVHLRQFYSPVLENRMYAIRKSDLKTFEPRSQSVCRIEEGSTNPYLRDQRAIEEFLLLVEPCYTRSIDLLRRGACDKQAVFCIAGFISYVLACSPAAMRFFSDPLRASVLTTATLLERQGKLPPAPSSLGGKSFVDLIESGDIALEIDPKYPQALGINSILGWVSVFGNSRWEILLNKETPFFTSDFPIWFERDADPRIVNKIVPLAPDLAVRVCPDIALSGAARDLNFTKLQTSRRKLNRRQAVEVNRLLVRCAEDAVFYRDDQSWVQSFVEKNRRFRIEGVTERIPTGTGFLNLSTHRVVSTKR